MCHRELPLGLAQVRTRRRTGDSPLAFTYTNRPSATPRPGLYIARGWDLDDAEALDDRGAFGPEISDALDAITTALRATVVRSTLG